MRIRLLVAVGVVTAGCGLAPTAPAVAPAPRDDAPATVLVVGRHGNAAEPALTAGVVPVLRATVDGQGFLALVVADGVPQPEPETAGFVRSCGNDLACAQQVQQQLDGAVAKTAAVRPVEPETDLLGALDAAARTLPATTGPRTVVVVDTGLSTAGVLRFSEPGVLDADAGEVADFLEANRALPDLRGVTVVLSGLGDTAAPQPPLDAVTRTNLRAIWTTVAARAGAADVRVVDTPLVGPPLPGLPPVTVVPVRPGVVFAPGQDVVELPDAVLGFRPDSAEPVDPDAARGVLTPLARRMVDEQLSATLVGTTSSAGAPDGQRRLSRERADAIAALLVELGVPTERLTTEGAGYVADPPDRRDGVLLPGPAAENRRVTVRLAGG